MKKKLWIAVNLVCFFYGAKAQFLQTYTGDNFSGINGALLQPASIADSRYKIDATIVGGQLSKSTNYVAYNADLLAGLPLLPKYYRKSKGKSYYYDNTELVFLSFMVTLTPKDAIGFTKRTRTITNIDGLDQGMALLLASEMEDTSLTNKPLKSKRLSYQQMKYKETAITYARVLMDNNERFLKAGVTAKILTGQEALYLYGKDVTLTQVNGTDVQLTNSQFSYGYSKHDKKAFNNKMGLGFDLGVVYEYRPKYKDYFYEMDGKKGIARRDLNKYKFRISASLLDIGRIKFTKTDSSGNFAANKTVSGIQQLSNDASNINTFVTSNFQTANNGGTFKMNLPTALSLQADYSLGKNIYAGYMSYIPIWFRSDVAKVHNILTNVVSVRYEKTNYGISVPVSLVRNGQVNAGLNIRYQALTVGATNVTSYIIGKRSLYDVNIYASLRFFIAYPAPADRDGDKVSDEKDECPDTPGPLSLAGCPDSDLDGVADPKDACPEAPGPIKLNGCPDIDGDGILDHLDACPTERGFAINNGCPDTDVDGVLDVADRCPDVPGIKENNGCPEIPPVCCADSDGDGILDRFDDCPQIFGQLTNKGCPADSNTLYHQNNIKGEELKKAGAENRDMNMVPKGNENNTLNKNVDTSAVVPDQNKINNESNTHVKETTAVNQNVAVVPDQNKINNESNTHAKETTAVNQNTSPTKKTGEMGTKKTANNADYAVKERKPLAIIYFDKNDYTVLPAYYKDLDRVTEELLKDKTLKLLIKGHTDFEGSDAYNMKLSENRATAVKNYILKKGNGLIDKERLEVLFYGEKEPVTDNGDDQKKQMNRRVELIIVN